jgi:hypothetical protein
LIPMKNLLLIVLVMTGMQAFAQSDFDISRDKENDQVVFKGKISFEDLEKESSFSWLKKGEDYKPDSNAVKFLKKNLLNYELVVLMGTWCDDSHEMIPKLYKTLLLTEYPMVRFNMYGVDRAKEAKYIEHKLYRVDKVPVVIVYKNHMEVGRITEVVKKSIEEDLRRIVEADKEQNP